MEWDEDTGSERERLLKKATFRAFLREHRKRIVDDWAEAVRTLAGHHAGRAPVLARHCADLLDHFAADAECGDARGTESEKRPSLDALDGAFELRSPLQELALFRETLLRTWQRAGMPGSFEEWQRLERVIDDAFATMAERYVNARGRLLNTLDRISSTALEARDLDELLWGIVDVVTRELPTVDFMTVCLREDDQLRVRAARGLEEEEVRAGTLIRIGEGFAGKIAAARRPFEISSASTDPRVVSESIRTKGVKGMYGVPLLAEGELLGVVTMGSLSVSELDPADRFLFDAAAHRATATIYQQMLRETAETRARQLTRSEQRFRAAFENSAVGIAHLRPDGSFIEANPRYSEIVGYSSDELRRLGWLDIAQPGDRARAKELLGRVLTGEIPSIHVEGPFRRRDGRHGWCDVFVSAVPGKSSDDSNLVAILQDITGRKEAESALRASEERLRLAVEATGLGTWDYDLQGDSIIGSERTRELLGLEETRSLRCEDLLTFIPDEDREPLETLVGEAIRTSNVDVITCEHRIRRGTDDDERWVSTRARLVLDSQSRPARIIGTVLDITDERRARERTAFLSEASQVLASSLDLDVTLERLARLAVPHMADLCVVDLMPAHGERHSRTVVAHADPRKEERIREIYRGPRDSDEPIARVLESGERVLLSTIDDAAGDDAAGSRFGPVLRNLVDAIGLRSFLAVPLVDQHARVGVLSLGRTSRRRLREDDLAFALELASRASDAIRNASLHTRVNHAVRMREQVLGIVSHDLRNPLGVIDLAGEVLLGTESIADDPAARAHIERILRSADRMERLIRDLLDLSSLQSGQLSLDRGHCELRPILDEVMEAHAASARKRGVAVELDMPRERLALGCDRDRLIQVLGNLLSNAIKFSPPGERVVLHAERREDHVFLAVHDRGGGIAPEDRAHIFEPYWHKDRAGRGTGLGLFISKGIIEAHGGRIGVRSRPGTGSMFWLMLPVGD